MPKKVKYRPQVVDGDGFSSITRSGRVFNAFASSTPVAASSNLNLVVRDSNPFSALNSELQNASGNKPLSGIASSPSELVPPLLGCEAGRWENETVNIESLGLLSVVELERMKAAGEYVPDVNVCTPSICVNVSPKSAAISSLVVRNTME